MFVLLHVSSRPFGGWWGLPQIKPWKAKEFCSYLCTDIQSSLKYPFSCVQSNPFPISAAVESRNLIRPVCILFFSPKRRSRVLSFQLCEAHLSEGEDKLASGVGWWKWCWECRCRESSLGLMWRLGLESQGAAGLCPQLLSGQSPVPAKTLWNEGGTDTWNRGRSWRRKKAQYLVSLLCGQRQRSSWAEHGGRR